MWWDKLKLSNDMKAIEVHERATSYYRASEKFAYKFLMDLKAIRDEKLYKALGFQDFEAYTLQNFGYTRETITNRIQSAEVWGSNYDEALRHFGKTKTRQLGIMPEKDRQKVLDDGIPTSEGIKSIDQATTREIESYKRKLKEKDSQLEQAKKSEQIAIEQLEREHNKEPEKIEVVPDEYKKAKENEEQLSQALKKAQADAKDYKEQYEYQKQLYDDMLEERSEVDDKSEQLDEIAEAISSSKGQLNEQQKVISNYKNVLKILRKTNNALLEIGSVVYLDVGGLIQTDQAVSTEFDNLITRTQKLADDLREMKNEPLIIEGVYTNEE